MKTRFIILFASLFFFFQITLAQKSKIELPMIDQPISDFKLSDQNGNEVDISNLKGKNIMLIFPRGMVKENYWCQICHYQYADLADIEQRSSIRQKYNLEVLFVLPYASDTVRNWIKMFPEQMEIINGWKYPKDSSTASEETIDWALKSRKLLPKIFKYNSENIETPFPVLADSERMVSNGFRLYKSDLKAPQNTPAIYIIDKEGKLRFKYICQDTTDRPSFQYLFQIIEKIVI
jgi:peroxiredoxin